VCRCSVLFHELRIPHVLDYQETIVDEQGDRVTHDQVGANEIIVHEYELIRAFKLDYFQRTGYSLDEDEVRDKIRKGEIKYY
jgi:hypothetical protein